LAAQQQAEAGISIAVEQGFANVRAQATIILGRALAEQGLADEGIALASEGLAAVGTAEAHLFQPGFLLFLARALLKGGRIEDGLAAIKKANALMEKTGERLHESEICQTRGELLLAHNPSNAAQAEQLFRDAIRVSRRQGARLLELHATTSLAGLLRDTNRRDEARAMLGEIYNWFTEGFDIADLKEAKALLDELASGS
jgi:predicted ATPase